VTITLAQHGLALALVLVDVAARGERMTQLIRVPLVRAMAINTCGDAFAAITPARLGGDPLRFIALRRTGVSTPELLAAFATELVADAVWMVVGVVVVAFAFADRGLALWHRIEQIATVQWIVWPVAAAIAGVAVLRLASRGGRMPAPLVRSLARAWQIARACPRLVIARVLALTFVSLAARIAILPALAGGIPGLRMDEVIAGSFALQVAQSVTPTPGGAGPVELGFLAGFAASVTGPETAGLLITWRLYTLALGVAAGGLLLLLTRWPRRVPASDPSGIPREVVC